MSPLVKNTLSFFLSFFFFFFFCRAAWNGPIILLIRALKIDAQFLRAAARNAATREPSIIFLSKETDILRVCAVSSRFIQVRSVVHHFLVKLHFGFLNVFFFFWLNSDSKCVCNFVFFCFDERFSDSHDRSFEFCISWAWVYSRLRVL